MTMHDSDRESETTEQRVLRRYGADSPEYRRLLDGEPHVMRTTADSSAPMSVDMARAVLPLPLNELMERDDVRCVSVAWADERGVVTYSLRAGE